MMKKILLIAPRFNSYSEIFSKAIKNCGYSVKTLTFAAYGWETALCGILHIPNTKIIKFKQKFFNKLIGKEYKFYHPDYVIVIRGDFVSKEILSKMSDSKKAIWLYDSIDRYPEMSLNWEYYDLHFVFENSDIEKLDKEGKKAIFLPLAYDPELYKPEKKEKTVDICFVGAMYETRKKLLEQLVEDYPNLNFEFYGIHTFKRHFINYIKFKKSQYNKAFKNKKLTHKEINTLVNRSRINVNILHEQSQSGWNARLNEILGAQGFELVSYNPLIAKKYNGMLDTFRDYDELKSKIEYYLNNEAKCEQIALKGYEYVKVHETYESRFSFIMKKLEEL